MNIDGREVKEVNCSFCQSSHVKKIFSKHGFSWVRCRQCGMVYVNPQLTEEAISNLYSSTYSEKSASLEKKIQPQHLRILKQLSKILGKGKLLDVGCFKADFLNVAKSKDWEVYGTEISKHAIDYAKKVYGIGVDKGSLLDIKYEDSFFDVVTMNDVIEHLHDPKAYVEKVAKIMKPGGVFYVGTPNFNSLSRVLFGKHWGAVIFPWHLQYFSVRTLRRLLEQHGFKIKKVNTRNILLWLKDPYQTMKDILAGKRVKGKSFFMRALNFGLNKIFNVLFYILDLVHIHIGAQIELYAVKK
jgi:2-polyprenyl-3-methyl-5-hydroxy-6-metoxy-1,4-benzoquinol methylase